MAADHTSSIPDILRDLPSRFRGPGGAVAVVKDGELAGEQVWGFADMHRHIPMASDTVIPICSISKQMLCGLFTDLRRNPTPAMVSSAGGNKDPSKLLRDQLAKVLPPALLDSTGLSFEHLCNNQSGIRDYWALTVLWGAMPDGAFSIADHGPLMLERVGKSLHFEPGTEYSYANTNFFVVARVLEQATGQPLAELLRERIFAPAGMETARLCADTATHPPPCVGYEGDENFGFYPAVNRIEWAGDAGIVASLADMVAYERFVDANRANPDSWYSSNSVGQQYKDGAAADYGFGLARQRVGGVLTVRHGGALRGYRLDRLYAPDHRVSVVALLNQEHGNAGEVGDYVLKRVLSLPTETKHETVEAGPGWTGTYLDPESQLAITVSPGVAGQVLVKYHRKPEKFRVVQPHAAETDDSKATLDGDTLHLDVPKDNRRITATRVAVAAKNPPNDIVGEYRCSEIDSAFRCSGTGSMLYCSFDGFLGKGPVHMMRPLAEDVWALACPRAMDSTPPGDWTVIVKRDAGGKVAGVTVGCWLARKLQFDRVEA